MAKSAAENAYRDFFARITRADRLCLCVGAPATYGAAVTKVSNGGNMVATIAIDSADFLIYEGSNGWILYVAQQTGVSILESGTADHVALVEDNSNSNELSYVNALSSSQAVTAGNTATINAWEIEVQYPT